MRRPNQECTISTQRLGVFTWVRRKIFGKLFLDISAATSRGSQFGIQLVSHLGYVPVRREFRGKTSLLQGSTPSSATGMPWTMPFYKRYRRQCEFPSLALDFRRRERRTLRQRSALFLLPFDSVIFFTGKFQPAIDHRSTRSMTS